MPSKGVGALARRCASVVVGCFAIGLLGRYATAADIGVTSVKLIIVDKLAGAGTAKVVYVSQDSGVTKGTATDVEQISIRFDVAYENGSAVGAFVIPPGSTNGWLVNNETVAKFVNKNAPDGPTNAKVAVVKPTKLLKVVGKGVGELPIDIVSGGDPSPQGVLTTYCVTNGVEKNCHCSVFPVCTYNLIAAGTGAKLVCKGGTSTTCPACSNGEVQPCGSNVGVCVEGTQTCMNGTFGTCVGEVGPSPELCNGLDDDCDGVVDEGAGGQPCDGPDTDLCLEGTTSCLGGALTCSDNTNSSTEVCNGIDDNCNGVVDEGNPCPSGFTCLGGACQ